MEPGEGNRDNISAEVDLLMTELKPCQLIPNVSVGLELEKLKSWESALFALSTASEDCVTQTPFFDGNLAHFQPGLGAGVDLRKILPAVVMWWWLCSY